MRSKGGTKTGFPSMDRFVFGGTTNYGQIAGFLPRHQKVGLITGDTRLLKSEHLAAAGADPQRLVIRGMENSAEFQNIDSLYHIFSGHFRIARLAGGS